MEMKIKYLVLMILMLTIFLLSGCQNNQYVTRTDTTDEKQSELLADYEYFTSLDFSDYTIYFDKNFYTLEDENDINWYNVISQNKEMSSTIYKLDYQYRTLNDSEVQLVNGQKSHLLLTYDDGHNPVASKKIQVVYIDVTKNLDGSDSNIVPKLYDFTHRHITVGEKDYTLEFNTYDNNYYGVWFLHISDDENNKLVRDGFRIANEDYRYTEKYTGPKTYYIDDIPVIKVWKDTMGYRVDILDSNITSTNDNTDYYVYSVDMDQSRSAYFTLGSEKALSLREFYSDFTYDIDYIEYDPILNILEISLHVYNEDGNIDYKQVFTLNDYYTQTFSKSDIDYDFEITRVKQDVVNITLFHKEYEDYIFSYSLQANKVKP